LLGQLTVLPRPLAGFKGRRGKRREGFQGREAEKERGREEGRGLAPKPPVICHCSVRLQ